MPIQPVILAKDKERIGELLSLAPEDLKDLGAKVDFIHLDGSRPAYWTAGMDEVVRNMEDLATAPQLRAAEVSEGVPPETRLDSVLDPAAAARANPRWIGDSEELCRLGLR